MTSRSRHASQRATRRRAVLAAAAEAIGPVTPGLSLFTLTCGAWSMLDAVRHVVAEVGCADLAVWTWAISAYDVAEITALHAAGLVRDAHLILDYDGLRSRSHDGVAQWQSVFGQASVLTAISHAKMVRIASVGGLRLLLRGSMNMNLNARWEQLDITEGGAEYAAIAALEAGLLRVMDAPTQGAVSVASRIRDAWEPESLARFGELRTWRI